MSSLGVWVDESEKGQFLAVGGFFAPWTSVPGIIDSWQGMKQKLGLKPNVEVKWNVPSDHPTREELRKVNYTTLELKQKAVEFIASRDDITCIVAVMVEERERRNEWWKVLWPGKSVRDFYCEGLRYVLQRVAEEVEEIGRKNCVMICDKPSLGKREFRYRSIRRGMTAVEEVYAEWYESGVGLGPGGQKGRKPLRELGFHPSPLIADATYNDMLQIADTVVSATLSWVDMVSRQENNPGLLNLIQNLTKRFRRRHGKPGFFGDGLVIWPWQNELWYSLQDSLR